MTSLQRDLNELRTMVINGQNNEIKNKIKEQIHIYNMFNNMLNQYRMEMDNIIMEYNKRSSSKNIIKCIDDDKKHTLLYDKNTDTYSFNINGTIIKGNIGNIFNTNDKNAYNVIECNNDDCKRIKCINDILHRNFFNTSWTYNINSNYTRNIGGKDTIIEDLNRMTLSEKKREYNLRASQLIHDILVLDKLIININDEEKNI